MHLFVFTNKFEGTPAERRGGTPEPHPVWTCHIQAHEKTELLMDAGCSLTLTLSVSLSLSLSFSFSLPFSVSEEGKEGDRQ